MSDHDIFLWMNLLATMVFAWGVVRAQRAYFRTKFLDGYRFKLFQLRDRLSLLVMQGNLEEGSREHLVLLRLIKSAIVSTNTFRVTDFIRFLVHFSRSKDVEVSVQEMRSILSRVDNEEYRHIVVEFFDTVGRQFHRDTRAFFMIYGAFSRFRSVAERARALRETESTICRYRNEFAGPAHGETAHRVMV